MLSWSVIIDDVAEAEKDHEEDACNSEVGASRAKEGVEKEEKYAAKERDECEGE